MEILLAYIILLESRVLKKEEYIKVLDDLFNKNPDDELLLELEWNTSDIIHSSVLIYSYYYNNDKFDYDLFGKYLLNRLEKFYLDKSVDIYEFSEKAYKLWTNLPSYISNKEPFFSLCYADDPLYWGDENQTRQIYEDIFKFYTL